MIFPDNVYKILKWVSIIAIPALVTFLGVVLPACGVDPGLVKNIVTIVAAVGTLIGALIGISNKNYYSKAEVVEETVESK